MRADEDGTLAVDASKLCLPVTGQRRSPASEGSRCLILVLAARDRVPSEPGDSSAGDPPGVPFPGPVTDAGTEGYEGGSRGHATFKRGLSIIIVLKAQ